MNTTILAATRQPILSVRLCKLNLGCGLHIYFQQAFFWQSPSVPLHSTRCLWSPAVELLWTSLACKALLECSRQPAIIIGAHEPRPPMLPGRVPVRSKRAFVGLCPWVLGSHPSSECGACGGSFRRAPPGIFV